MAINLYARCKPMHDAVGRLDYITSPDRQEHLLAVAGQTDVDFWQHLAHDSQEAWQRSGGSRTKTVKIRNKETGEMEEKEVRVRACEAREICFTLPGELLSDETAWQRVADAFAKDFTETQGVPCAVGMHRSKSDWNIHIHCLFPERQLLLDPEIKLADRNVFLDENGIRRRTKKEILDEDGEIRSGCRIVPKGSILSERYFGDKDPVFAEKGWLEDLKVNLADWINRELDPDVQRTVFDANGPYLAQVHIGKGRPEEQEKRIREYNALVRQYNLMVDRGAISLEDAHRVKAAVMIAPDRQAELESILAGTMNMGWLAGTTLHEMSEEQLDRKEIARTPERTAVGPDEKKKRELKDAYRLARVERQAARLAEPGSLDQAMHKSKAREYSAKIDRLRRDLGYYTQEDYQKSIQRKDDWYRKARGVLQKRRSSVHFWNEKVRSKRNYVRNLESRLRSLSFGADPGYRADLERRLGQARTQLQEYEDKAFQAYYAQYQAKQKVKEAKKQLKAEKKEARQAERNTAPQRPELSR